MNVGAGKNNIEARSPIIETVNGVKIGILGATDNEPSWGATEADAGNNYFHVQRLNQLLADIKALKKKVDTVIVSLHWGPNMRLRPTQEYIDAAHKMIDAGADIIQGHSAHLFQGVELYHNKLIMYDTGDFVDDYRVDPQLHNDWSFLFFVTINKKGIQGINLIPILISNMQVNLAKEPEKSTIMKQMQQLSQEFGTDITVDGTVTLQGDESDA